MQLKQEAANKDLEITALNERLLEIKEQMVSERSNLVWHIETITTYVTHIRIPFGYF